MWAEPLFYFQAASGFASAPILEESDATMKHSFSLFLVMLAFSSHPVFAWGKRGHQVVCETAALLAAQEPNGQFLKARAFDLGYYCNVPDFIWKREATYGMERPQHFMDMEHFEAAFKKKPEVTKPFELSRKEFETQFPELNENSGRAFWRMRELNDMVTPLTQQMAALPDDKVKEKQALQEKWLVLVGVMGHYIGDLAMPLHVTENHDGQMTGQKGVHSYYEEDSVDELYPKFRLDVHNEAVKRWPKFKKENEKKTLAELMEQLSKISFKDIKPLLDIDKKNKRDPVAKTSAKYQKLITKNLVDASLTLAEIYRRQLGFKFDNTRFYFFAGEPEYIKPGEGAAKPATAAEKK